MEPAMPVAKAIKTTIGKSNSSVVSKGDGGRAATVISLNLRAAPKTAAKKRGTGASSGAAAGVSPTKGRKLTVKTQQPDDNVDVDQRASVRGSGSGGKPVKCRRCSKAPGCKPWAQYDEAKEPVGPLCKDCKEEYDDHSHMSLDDFRAWEKTPQGKAAMLEKITARRTGSRSWDSCDVLSNHEVEIRVKRTCIAVTEDEYTKNFGAKRIERHPKLPKLDLPKENGEGMESCYCLAHPTTKYREVEISTVFRVGSEAKLLTADRHCHASLAMDILTKTALEKKEEGGFDVLWNNTALRSIDYVKEKVANLKKGSGGTQDLMGDEGDKVHADGSDAPEDDPFASDGEEGGDEDAVPGLKIMPTKLKDRLDRLKTVQCNTTPDPVLRRPSTSDLGKFSEKRTPSPAKSQSMGPAASIGPRDSVSQVGDDDEDDEDDATAVDETPLVRWMRKTSLEKVANGVKLQRQLRFAVKAMEKMGKGEQKRMNTHLQQVASKPGSQITHMWCRMLCDGDGDGDSDGDEDGDGDDDGDDDDVDGR